MGTIEVWRYSRSDLEEVADHIKAGVIFALVSEELLDKEEANNWSKTHTLLMRKKSFFRTLLEKVIKTDDEDTTKFIVVKKV